MSSARRRHVPPFGLGCKDFAIDSGYRVTRSDSGSVLIANPGADLYGSDRMALETARALVADGRRVVVTVPEDGPLIPLLRDACAEVIECPTPIVRKSLISPRGLLELVRLVVTSIVPGLRVIRRSAADTIIVNTITCPLWLPLARLSGLHTVCHVHEGESSAPGALRRTLYVPLVFAHRVLVNSAFSLGVLRQAAPRLARRTSVLYNAVAGPDEVVVPRERIDGPARLLYVGRLSRRKGPHIAIEALHLLTSSGVDARLALLGSAFAGKDAYTEELRELVASHGLEARTMFLGFKPSVWADLAEADVVLIPSTVDEPFGNTAVEAALAARPAVVSDVGGLPEARAHSTSSVLVPAGDAAALADAVKTIIEHWPSYAAKAVSDASSVAETFSSRRYGREMVAALSRPVPHRVRTSERPSKEKP